LAALVANYIEKRSEKGKAAVISIFLQQDVTAYETAFLEDVLLEIYQRLEGHQTETEEPGELYDEYKEARFVTLEGSRTNRRIDLIRKAVLSRVKDLLKSIRVYLVLDGLERCNSILRLLLETELSALQDCGLSIFITSRIAVFEQLEAFCDNPNHGDASEEEQIDEDDLEALELYFVCRNDDQVMCFPCRDANRRCGEW
jgi:hypothetical protein